MDIVKNTTDLIKMNKILLITSIVGSLVFSGCTGNSSDETLELSNSKSYASKNIKRLNETLKMIRMIENDIANTEISDVNNDIMEEKNKALSMTERGFILMYRVTTGEVDKKFKDKYDELILKYPSLNIRNKVKIIIDKQKKG